MTRVSDRLFEELCPVGLQLLYQKIEGDGLEYLEPDEK